MTQAHPGHEKHMCELVAKKTNIQELKKLVAGARFICKSCGRAAAKQENLCAPEAL